MIQQEIHRMGFTCSNLTVLQEKDGITVARIASGNNSYVIKHFQNPDFRREIANYMLLSQLGIPTIHVIATTDTAIVLEDIEQSSIYRLGRREDMDDPEVAHQLAAWYKQLHTAGYSYTTQHGDSLYDESDYFTLKNINLIKEKTGTQKAPVWKLLEQHFNHIHTKLRSLNRTLTYNDFYYTNMVVAKDHSSALMFDYNLLGKGYAYGDLRNVTSSLSKEAGDAFLEAYGSFDPVEKLLDDVVSTIVTLYLACQREQFPTWAQALVDEININFIEKVDKLLSLK